ncbi:MAG: hypothetical protein AABX04_07435 [Nanoarchaeota archaeon]
MEFDLEWYEQKFRELLSNNTEDKFFIRRSNHDFKTKLYREKGLESFRIASFLLSGTKNASLRNKLDLPELYF